MLASESEATVAAAATTVADGGSSAGNSLRIGSRGSAGGRKTFWGFPLANVRTEAEAAAEVAGVDDVPSFEFIEK